MENEINSLVVQDNISNEEIKNLIYTIRGKQVMLDSDVAMLYHYPTKRINEAVNRNKQRFPENFCFQLTEEEYKSLRFKNFTFNEINSKDINEDNSLRSQIATLDESAGRGKHRKYLPYVFTEQGIAMLSGLLKNDIAIQVSINIMNAFVEMRKFLAVNGQLFERLTNVEYKLLEHDKKFDKVFDQLQNEENIKQKIFFEGQIYDAYSLIIDIFKKANKKILIIDNYIDDSVLKMLTKKNKNIEVVILTSDKSNIQKIDIQKFNKEYPILKVAKTNKFHDRFIVIDNKEMYHLGASIKDLGKKCFGINRIEDIENINKITKEKINKIPDAEIYTDVFSRIEKEEIEKFQYKINYNMIRNKMYENSKVLGKYNLVLDATRFQKAHYEISPEWLHETKERKNNMVFINVRIKVSSK